MDVPSFAPDRKKCINAIFAPDHFRGRTRRADPGPMEPEPRTTNAGTAAAARSYAPLGRTRARRREVGYAYGRSHNICESSVPDPVLDFAPNHYKFVVG